MNDRNMNPKILNRYRYWSLFFLALIPAALTAAENPPPFNIPRTQVIEIEDSKNQRNYELYIKLPSAYDYSENSEAQFPVVYITDASYNFPTVEGFTRIPMNQELMQAAIIVGVSWEVGLNPIDSRVRDYTPTVDEEFARETGGADAHLRFIQENVFSYMEQHFRVDANNRIYVGYSLGGLLGAYALLTRPEMFKDYILISPSLWFDNKYILRLEASGKFNKPKLDTRVLISAGEFETPKHVNIKNNLVADAEQFHRRLQSWKLGNVESKLHIVDEAIHQIAFPEPAMKGLYWLLRK